MSDAPLYAGSALGAVHDVLGKGGRESLRSLVTFEVQTSQEGLPIDDSLFAVADNFISRGGPTLASPRVERALAAGLGLTREAAEDADTVRFPFAEDPTDGDLEWLRRALAIVDPRVPCRLQHARPPLESPAEEAFFDRGLPDIVGPWVRQLVELQRAVSTILPHEADEFVDQRVDFSVELPQHSSGLAGLVIEIDGMQHREGVQLYLDKKRVAAMRKVGWPTVRVEARNEAFPSPKDAEIIQQYFAHPEAEHVAANWAAPLWTSSEGRRWMQAALTPFVVARVQKALVRLVLDGLLDPEADVWRVAVVERDVPGARLAVEDLSELLGHLADLEGLGRSLPQIELRVYRTAEFEACELAAGDEGERYDPDGRDVLDFEADVLLDVSVLQRAGFSEPGKGFVERVAPKDVVAVVRSAFSVRDEPRVTAARPVDWVGIGDEGTPEALVYLLQTAFRKRGFREKQVDVMRPALRGGCVAGILPTGAGKSICYQLPALLQPGVTFVVAPLKSLMKDQHDNLVRAGIDRTAFVNSTLKAKQRQRVQASVRRGAFQFVFVSPERFLIQEFRDEVADLDVPLAYCVVDEAHCVSEWGHDFRTAYLRLGQNVREHCRTAWPARSGRSALPIIALTGTASFDVLADLRRELEFGPDVPDVLPDSFARKELDFEIVLVPRPPRLEGKKHDYWAVRKAVIAQKVESLRDVLNRLPGHFGEGGDGASNPEAFYALDGSSTRSGLVFTPHANGGYGVQAIRRAVEDAVPALKGAVGCYASSDETMDNQDLEATQSAFKDNKLSTLVATKAFGMGIDKPNIRYIVHTNFSQSIESYYQEAGRAGRDREPARCVVLYCDQPLTRDDGTESSADLDLMLFFHGGSFKGADRDLGAIDELMTRGARPDDGEADSLDALMEQLQPGEVRVVTIPFANDVVGEMSAYLQQHVDTRLKRALVAQACERAADIDEVVEEITKRLGGENARDVPDFEPHRGVMERLYLRRRDEGATFKAIYRLSTVGLVEDYVLDYNAKVVRAWVRKRPDHEHVEALRSYLARYVAPEKVNALWNEVQGRTGKGIVRDCVDYLLKFVYSTIADKRLTAIGLMEEAVQEGATKGAAAFQARINTYFDSRYTPDLRERLGEGLAHYDLNLVWEYIDVTEGVADNVKHLRGACDRLLVSAPNNGGLLLLRAFTRALEHGDPSLFESDFQRGWAPFLSEKGVSRTEYVAGLSNFYRRVAAYDTTAVPPVAAFIAREQASWLRTFNDRFATLPT